VVLDRVDGVKAGAGAALTSHLRGRRRGCVGLGDGGQSTTPGAIPDVEG
jgi:hypothetical protein